MVAACEVNSERERERDREERERERERVPFYSTKKDRQALSAKNYLCDFLTVSLVIAFRVKC